jgi:lipopolysaccharide export system protein LptA|tara:strand:+ start:152310 stop:153131 length:822 start_codon:yes stop_codon:yes gene_type:complete
MTVRTHLSTVLCLSLLALGTAMPLAHAQNKDSSQPLEISADGALEWHRDKQLYIANGAASATQGATTIKARVLEAYYREPKAGGMEIWKIIAKDNVEIRSENGNAYGDHAIYNLDESIAIMTGKDLRMLSDDQSLTANERFEYYTADNKLVAIGNAVITRPTETLESDTVTAWFKDGDASRELWRAEVDGNVHIKTAQESITGDKGEYRKEDNKAEIIGNVVIRRGQNILEGTRAELDLLTNVSKVYGGKAASGALKGDGRVRGTFFPESKNK